MPEQHPLPGPQVGDAAAHRDAFIAAMRKACSTVCVVTTDGPAGRFGVTVSAMTSVTADPPAVLVCVNSDNFVIPAVLGNGSFCVNLLNEGQREVSEVFAGRRPAPDGNRFGSADWITLETGSPGLIGAAAVLDCRLAHQHQFGSHTLFIGTVGGVELSEGKTLVYHDRNYCSVAVRQ